MQLVDKAVMILTNDNLELACQVVEKTASEKAIREVDERLQMAYQVQCDDRNPCENINQLHRRVHNAVRSGSMCCPAPYSIQK